jgi:uncharacterized protein DUF3108
MNGRTNLVGASVIVACLLHSPGISGQDVGGRGIPVEPVMVYEVDPNAAPVPFGPGEYLEYGVKAGVFGVGSAFFSVAGLDTVRGFSTYRVQLGISGGLPFGLASIDDEHTSWLDTEGLLSHRYTYRTDTGDYKSQRVYEFYPDELAWERTDSSDGGDLASALPLDLASFFFFIRTLDYEVGQTYSFNRYYKEAGNPVRIEVLRKDHRKTDAGEFDTIVLRPVIPGENLVDEDSKAEIHISDDENRYIVYLKSETGILGVAIALELKAITPGQLIYQR